MDIKTKETSNRWLFKTRMFKLPDPVTKPVEVKSFMKSNITLQGHMKKEVKYARMSCTSMKESHVLFRLKKTC